MFEVKIFILEFLAINGLATRAIARRKVTALDHEAFDNAMKGAAFEVEGFARLSHSFLARGEGSEVFGGFGDD